MQTGEFITLKGTLFIYLFAYLFIGHKNPMLI